MKKLKIKKSTFFADFKAFITKGNIVDLAVAVVIGNAFSAIINSLVNDIIMPLLTLATGDGVQGLTLVLNGVDKYLADGTINPEAVLWSYGNFIQTIINFIIIALCIFVALRIITKVKDASGSFIANQKKALKEKFAKEDAAETESEAEAAAVADEATVEAVATVTENVVEAAADGKPTSDELLAEILAELKKLNLKGSADLEQ